MTEELKPCPFCGSEIRHVESLAKSFAPPRLYHEWHHVLDNADDCPIRRHVGRIVASTPDDEKMQGEAVRRWNTRQVGAVAQREPVAWKYEYARAREWILNRPAAWSDWAWGISFEKPSMPEGSIRNLTALYLGVPAERQTVKTAQELAGALADGETAAAIARLRSYFNDDDSAEIVDYDALEDCRLLLAEYERIASRSPAVSDKRHPWYGPCDALGPQGQCAECMKLGRHSQPETDADLPTAADVRGILPIPSTVLPCAHDWQVWPETDGKSQKCSKCSAFRDTPKLSPQENNRG